MLLEKTYMFGILKLWLVAIVVIKYSSNYNQVLKENRICNSLYDWIQNTWSIIEIYFQNYRIEHVIHLIYTETKWENHENLNRFLIYRRSGVNRISIKRNALSIMVNKTNNFLSSAVVWCTFLTCKSNWRSSIPLFNWFQSSSKSFRVKLIHFIAVLLQQIWIKILFILYFNIFYIFLWLIESVGCVIAISCSKVIA